MSRNKVQYRTFDFQVLETEHFDIYYYTREQAGSRITTHREGDQWACLASRCVFDIHQ